MAASPSEGVAPHNLHQSFASSPYWIRLPPLGGPYRASPQRPPGRAGCRVHHSRMDCPGSCQLIIHPCGAYPTESVRRLPSLGMFYHWASKMKCRVTMENGQIPTPSLRAPKSPHLMATFKGVMPLLWGTERRLAKDPELASVRKRSTPWIRLRQESDAWKRRGSPGWGITVFTPSYHPAAQWEEKTRLQLFISA